MPGRLVRGTLFFCAVALCTSSSLAGAQEPPPPPESTIRVAPPPPPAPPPAPPAMPPAGAPPVMPRGKVGGAGESCRASSDCGGELRCVGQICRDDREGSSCQASPQCGPNLICRANTCVPPVPYAVPVVATLPPPRPRLPMPFDGRTHGFVGAVMAGGLSFTSNVGSFTDLNKSNSFLFGVRAGLIAGRGEYAIEFAPGTYLPNAGNNNMLSVVITAGSYSRLSQHWSWPNRAGLGVVAYTPAGPLMQFRLDLIGLAYSRDNWIVELSLPSYRFSTEFQKLSIHSLFFGPTVNYVF